MVIYNALSDEHYKNNITTNTVTLSADYINYYNDTHYIFKKIIKYNFVSKPNDPEKYSSINDVLQHIDNIQYENISVSSAHINNYKYIYTLYIRSLPQECNIFCQPGEVRKIQNQLCYKKNFIATHTPQTVLEDVRNDKCLLLLNDSYECTVLSDSVMTTLLQFCSELSLPSCNVNIVTGNMYNKQHVDHTKYPFKIIYLQLFECSIKSVINQTGNIPIFFKKRVANKPNRLRFVYLNSSLRSHRIYLFMKLIKDNQFLKHARTSFLTPWSNCEQRIVDYERLVNNRYVTDVFLEELKKTNILHGCEDIMQKLPLRVKGESADITFKKKPWSIISKDIYSDIAIHIVTETIADYGDDTMFLTEKTFKPIATMSPFIIFGNANILKILRDQGYKTFNHLWDESYDCIRDPVKRANAIHDIILHITRLDNVSFNKLLNMTYDTVEYNYKHFLSRTPGTELADNIQKWYT